VKPFWTTQLYTDDLDADELAAALARAVEARELQASSDSATDEGATLKYPRNRLVDLTGLEPLKVLSHVLRYTQDRRPPTDERRGRSWPREAVTGV